MRQRPAFLPAEPAEQLADFREAEALDIAEQALTTIESALDQVEADRGNSPALQHLRERFNLFLPDLVALKARADQMRADLAEFTVLGEMATNNLGELFRDLNRLLAGETPDHNLFHTDEPALQRSQTLQPEEVEDTPDA